MEDQITLLKPFLLLRDYPKEDVQDSLNALIEALDEGIILPGSNLARVVRELARVRSLIRLAGDGGSPITFRTDGWYVAEVSLPMPHSRADPERVLVQVLDHPVGTSTALRLYGNPLFGARRFYVREFATFYVVADITPLMKVG